MPALRSREDSCFRLCIRSFMLTTLLIALLTGGSAQTIRFACGPAWPAEKTFTGRENQALADKAVRETPDLALLTGNDKEFVLRYGSPENEARIWSDYLANRPAMLQHAVVVGATASTVSIQCGEEAFRSGTADFVLHFASTVDPGNFPPGSMVTFRGVVRAHDREPFVISISDAAIVPLAAPALSVPR